MALLLMVCSNPAVWAQRHQNESGDWSVTRRLSGPGVRDGSGVLAVNRSLRERLLAGEIFLEIFTRADPAWNMSHLGCTRLPSRSARPCATAMT